jgi:hypothetical protein
VRVEQVLARKRDTRWGLLALWLCSAFIGAILALLRFLPLIDPVGSKHADDSDPFGPPDGQAYPAVVMVIWYRTRTVASGAPRAP